MNSRIRHLWKEQTGAAYAGIELVLVLGIILLPLLAGIAQLPRWVDAKSTADLAAQEAARQMVLADSYDEGLAAAQSMVATIITNRGMDIGAFQGLTFNGALARGATVTATVTLEVPPVIFPGVGAVGGNITISRSATERVDDYRQFGEP